MPIKPSAVSVAAGSTAFSMPTTDMVTTTATQPNVNLSTMFAQIFDSLHSLSGGASDAPSPATPPSSLDGQYSAAAVRSGYPSDTSRKPTKSHPATGSPAPGSAPATSAIGMLNSAHSYALVPTTGAESAHIPMAGIVSSTQPVANAPKAGQASDQSTWVPTSVSDAVPPLMSSSLPFHSGSVSSDVVAPDSNEPSRPALQNLDSEAATQTSGSSTFQRLSAGEQSHAAPATVSASNTAQYVARAAQLPLGPISHSTQITEITREPSEPGRMVAPAVARPSTAQSLEISTGLSQGAGNATASVGTEESTSVVATAPAATLNTKLPAASLQDAPVANLFGTQVTGGDRTATANRSMQTDSKSILAPSPWPAPTQGARNESSREARDQELGGTKVWLPGHVSSNTPVARIEPVAFRNLIDSENGAQTAVAPTESSPSAAPMNSDGRLHDVFDSTRPTQSVPPATASPAKTNSETENLAAALLDASHPRVPATFAPNVEPATSFIEKLAAAVTYVSTSSTATASTQWTTPQAHTVSALSFSEPSTTPKSASLSMAASRSSDRHVDTGDPSAAVAFAGKDAEIPRAPSATQSTRPTTSVEPVQTAQPSAHARAARNEQPLTAPIPVSGSDDFETWGKPAFQPTSLPTDLDVSGTQVAQSVAPATAFMPGVHLRESSENVAAVTAGRKSGDAGTVAAQPPQAQISKSANAPKASRVTATESPLLPTLLDVEAGVAEISSDTAVPQTSSQDPALTATLSANAAANVQPGVASPTPTTPDITAETQDEAGTRSLHIDSNMAKALGTRAPFILNASDGPAPAQTISTTAESAPKADLNPSTPPSTSGTQSGPSTAISWPASVSARTPIETPELSAGLQAWNGGDNPQTRLVQAAHLGGSAHESEMNIALQAGALGGIELRTRVSGDVVGAAISVEHHDAHATISNDLPALHQALHEQRLRVGDVSVVQGSIHSGTSLGDGRASQQRESASHRPPVPAWTAAGDSEAPELAFFTQGQETGTLFDSNGRLSVRA